MPPAPKKRWSSSYEPLARRPLHQNPRHRRRQGPADPPRPLGGPGARRLPDRGAAGESPRQGHAVGRKGLTMPIASAPPRPRTAAGPASRPSAPALSRSARCSTRSAISSNVSYTRSDPNAVATRYDKLGDTFLATLKVVAIRARLRHYEFTTCDGGVSGIARSATVLRRTRRTCRRPATLNPDAPVRSG